MAGIEWRTEFETALDEARRAGKPIFQDFWFDG